MTPKQEAALRLALEALEYASTGNRRPEIISPSISALREALAEQPAPVAKPHEQQEPVGVVGTDIGGTHLMYGTKYVGTTPDKKTAIFFKDVPVGSPLYTSPQPSQPWVGLTDEEKSDLWCESTGRDCVNEDTHVFADAIEAKLREKNNG